MMLKQIREPAEILAIRQAFFSFDTPSNISVLMHSINIDGQLVGYVATEDFNTVGGPHIFIKEGFRCKPYMVKVGWMFKNVYCKLMKALGKEFLVTTCDDKDRGTVNFLTKCGFSIDTHVVAQYKL